MHNGFADSHLYLNQWIGTQKQWGAAELEQRGRTANLYQLPPAVAGSPKELTENIYLEQNTSTSAKISLLHKLFAAYKTEESDLVFYLKDNSGQEEKQNG